LLAVALTASAVAQAKLTSDKIVLGRAMGDIAVGMTRAHVEGLVDPSLGRGLVIGGRGVRVEVWARKGAKISLSAFFKGASLTSRAIGFVTNNPAYSGPHNIRVTSTTAEVEAAFPSLHCSDSQDSNPDRPYKSCAVYGPSGRVTIFYFDAPGAGDVTRIALGVASIASMP